MKNCGAAVGGNFKIVVVRGEGQSGVARIEKLFQNL